MRKIIKESKKNKKELFTNTAIKLGINTSIIEKDFWVCYILDYLFNRSIIKNAIVFKGGTSLSMCFHLIKRFSEDIDLALNWELLGYSKNEPWLFRSRKKQDLFNKQLQIKTENYLSKEFLPSLTNDLRKEVGKPIKCYFDKKNSGTIVIEYPTIFNDPYITPYIKLEIGTLAEQMPSEIKRISPLVSSVFPKLFKQKFTNVLALLPERTFWEKVTILHKEANRPENKQLPLRYSRHYYDLFCMYNLPIKNKALKNHNLLNKVVNFKNKFYACTWADYSNAKIGTIKLLPKLNLIKDLKQDYMHMKNMIYGAVPEFNTILKILKKLEKEINTLRLSY